jgi:ABC-type Mn2+/Zn2+ transport system ATPase subunit
MFVRRLQVEEGFLADLDLEFHDGLNVIIGPRGAGKTSVIELIRFCLGIEGTTDESARLARTHALSVLGSGRVTVTLQDRGADILVSRTANDDLARTSSDFLPPLVFSQQEIERVGLEARGRLFIIDGLADSIPTGSQEEKHLEATIRSYTEQLRQLGQEREATSVQIAALATVSADLQSAQVNQASVLANVKASQKQQERLAVVNAEVSAGRVKGAQLDKAAHEVDEWYQLLARSLDRKPHLAQWPPAAGPVDELAQARAQLNQLSQSFLKTLEDLGRLIEGIERIKATSDKATLKLEEEARRLRKNLEDLKTGAGTAAQKVAALREKVGQLDALRSRANELDARVGEVKGERAKCLSELQNMRDRRYQFRSRIANSLTEELGPQIEVSVEQGGDAPAFVAVVQAAIRGSGLHYKSLAPQLAAAMSPRELAEAVEENNLEAIATLSGIGEERASKVVAAITRAGTEDIITAPINDRVTMKLLVGSEYRPTTELSTGQRCTVVLSVLLGYKGRGLVMDQPEDHLDNAFIVGTLIEAIRRRKAQTQMILTTHNANIPVLGDADRVVLLGSDGQRGFVRHAGALLETSIVEAITSVMEGGYKAFRRRAQFYQDALK